MKNVKHEIKGNQLIITVDVGSKSLEQATKSASGKTLVVASSQGNMPVGQDLVIGLNVFTKKGL